MKLNRRLLVMFIPILLAVLLLSLSCAPAVAPGPAISLKYSHGYAVGSPEHPYFLHKVALLFKENTEKYTDGRVTVEIFPAAQLFKAKEEIEAVRRGDVDVVATPSLYAAAVNKFENIRNFPVITEQKGLQKWTTDDRIYETNRKVYEEEVGGLKFLGYIATPAYKMLWTSRPIAKLADFNGLKVRSSTAEKEMWAALGASVVTISAGEVLTSLQTGMIDGSYMTYSWARSNSLWEFSPYASPKGVQPFNSTVWEPILFNKQSWDKIGEKDQKALIEKVLPAVRDEIWDFMLDEEEANFILFKENGVQFSWLTGDDLAKFTALRDAAMEKSMQELGIYDYYQLTKQVIK